ncbi:MAG: glycosyltransferase [Succinivibrio sp.]|nr:glycosyltransferase [Succinivibrio sp.]
MTTNKKTGKGDSTQYVRFAREFKAQNGVMCFLIDFMPGSAADGLEMAVIRRASLFQRYFDCDIIIFTNLYQSRITEDTQRQIELGRIQRLKVINLYDYVQGINRNGQNTSQIEPVLPELDPSWKIESGREKHDTSVTDKNGKTVMYIRRYPSGQGVDYICYYTKGRLSRRDTYDLLGFISRMEFMDPTDGTILQRVYLRPDHSVALMERPGHGLLPGKNANDYAIDLLDRKGNTALHFFSHDELIAWWLLTMLRDKSVLYMLICDRPSYYQRSFREFGKRKEEYSNIRTICIPHSRHTLTEDTLNGELSYNYGYLADRSVNMDAVCTLTDWQRDDIVNRYGDNDRLFAVIPHFLDPISNPGHTSLASNILPPHSMILVGRLTRGKGQFEALSVLKKVLQRVPDATLHFFGKGEDEAVLRQKAAQEQLADKVFFHGFVTEMPPVYDQASLLLSCSMVEAFGLVILEALFHGCPVVAFNVRYGPSSMIKEGEDGYLHPLGDLDGMAAHCADILSDEKLRNRLSDGARKIAESFLPSAIAAKWAELLGAVLPRRKQSASSRE